jgi:hypothetical protein
LRGFDGLADRRRPHYLWVRHDEVDRLRRKPTVEMKVEHVHNNLLEAREQSRVVRKALAAKGIIPPKFSHLDRWLGLIAREASVPEAA